MTRLAERALEEYTFRRVLFKETAVKPALTDTNLSLGRRDLFRAAMPPTAMMNFSTPGSQFNELLRELPRRNSTTGFT